MATRTYNLSIVEAVETLSSIADLEFNHDVGIAEKHELSLGDEKINYRLVRWLHEKDAAKAVGLVRETFRVILHYLEKFYHKDHERVADQKTLDGIKTIMVLVGEAAKKLDKYTAIFHQTKSVTDLREYRKLQEFYKTKIARKADDEVINKWMLGLALGIGKTGREIAVRALQEKEKANQIDRLANTKHVFVDLDAVKKDTEYELFFIRKEDGSRFFSPRLLRNIKLVCDFGSYFEEKRELDPLESVKEWSDRLMHTYACELVKGLGMQLDHFFHELKKYKEHDLAKTLNKALIALLMSSHSQNLMRNQPIKNCSEYFIDFQYFLRETLQSSIYQKWLAYPPKESSQLAHDLLVLIHTLCRLIYTQLKGMNEMKQVIQGLIQEAAASLPSEKGGGVHLYEKVTGRMAYEYNALLKLIKHHPNGPLFKMIQILEEGSFSCFDTLLQYNIPNHLYDLFTENKRYAFLRIPAPISQEFIDKAVVAPEFNAFLRLSSQKKSLSKHLIINMQDRTSWRDYVRCRVLEDLQGQSGISEMLDVVTLAADTEFYHQASPYNHSNHAQLFKKQFKELLLDESSGFFFPSKIKRKDLSLFIDKAFEAIHKTFFSSKNVLARESRLSFIEIFYLMLELKIVEWLQPSTVSISCKDGVDIGEAHSVAIFAFLKLINNKEWTEADWERLNLMLYAPSLLIRERMMQPDRFNRMLSALKSVENVRMELGGEEFAKLVNKAFTGLYETLIINADII